MKQLIFGRWDGELVDNRGKDIAQSPPFASRIPEYGDGEQLLALMSGKGLLVFDERVNMAEMLKEYVSQIQHSYCCGKCITGRMGSKLVLESLGRLLDGEGKEGDIERLEELGDVLAKVAKCSVCQVAGRLLTDTLKYFREDYESPKQKADSGRKVRFAGKVSAPCLIHCPAHIDIPDFIEKINEMRFEEALEIIRQNMPFPGVCGRICPHGCEYACSLATVGSAIPIRVLKRAAADYELHHKLVPRIPRKSAGGKKVAVIGAGPAGLSAAFYLAQMGHAPTVFEALPVSGGMIAVGIPPYRQPKRLLQREIKIIEEMGVEVKTGMALGVDVTLQGLFDQGYDAVFIGVGAHKSSKLGIEGEDMGYEGFFSGGIHFLRDVNMGKEVSIGERVVVVGGGNTAIDCVRTSKRLGAKEVHLVYRRSRKEMPAEDEEVEDAEAEGIQFHFLTNPVRILAEKGRVTGMECVRMELGEPDKSGRRRPVPIPGSEFLMEADTIIPAIGQYADLSFIGPDDGIEITRHNTIKVDEETLMSSREGVFAGGDVVFGPMTVVQAVWAGRRAAVMMDRYLREGRPYLTDEERMETFLCRLEENAKTGWSMRIPGKIPLSEGQRHSTEKLDVEERTRSFQEVESGLTQKSSMIEASRCLRCFHLTMLALG